MYKFYWILFLTTFTITSCKQEQKEKWRHVEILSPDKTQVITIITKSNRRYIMDGIHSVIPKDNYLLLDISQVDGLGDAIAVCWNDSGYKWKLDNAYAKLVENKLDTTDYLYFHSLGKYGEPVSIGYMGNSCGSFLIREIEYRKPKGNLTVRYVYNSGKGR